jgi:hypothetical protein
MLSLLPPLLCPLLTNPVLSPDSLAPGYAQSVAAPAPLLDSAVGLLAGSGPQVNFQSPGPDAGYQGHTLRWRYVQFQADLGEPDGWRISGSNPLTENVALQGAALLFDEDNVEGAVFQGGALFHHPITQLESSEQGPFREFEGFAALNLLHLSAGGTENGYSIEAGARAIFVENVEGEVALGYADLLEGDLFFRARGEYELTRFIGLTAGTVLSDDSIFFAGVRFYPDRQF